VLHSTKHDERSDPNVVWQEPGADLLDAPGHRTCRSTRLCAGWQLREWGFAPFGIPPVASDSDSRVFAWESWRPIIHNARRRDAGAWCSRRGSERPSTDSLMSSASGRSRSCSAPESAHEAVRWSCSVIQRSDSDERSAFRFLRPAL